MIRITWGSLISRCLMVTRSLVEARGFCTPHQRSEIYDLRGEVHGRPESTNAQRLGASCCRPPVRIRLAGCSANVLTCVYAARVCCKAGQNPTERILSLRFLPGGLPEPPNQTCQTAAFGLVFAFGLLKKKPASPAAL